MSTAILIRGTSCNVAKYIADVKNRSILLPVTEKRNTRENSPLFRKLNISHHEYTGNIFPQCYPFSTSRMHNQHRSSEIRIFVIRLKTNSSIISSLSLLLTKRYLTPKLMVNRFLLIFLIFLLALLAFLIQEEISTDNKH